MLYVVFRTGWNAANQSAASGSPRRVAVCKVEAEDGNAACALAATRVSVYNNQYLDAELAADVDAREAEIDSAVEVL